MIESGYFMNAIRRSLEMVKGDTLSFGFEVKGLKGQRPEAVQFSCKDKLEDTGYVFSVSLADTIDFRSYDAEKDILTYGVRVPPNKTAGIYAGSYFYDLELRVNGDVITLMIGRLQIDEQITNSAVPPSPSYEDGDNTLYPVQDIPEGRKKAYSEQAVSDIATQIEETLDEYLGYKVGDMAPAIETIKFAISDINEATKTLTDSTEDYTLAEIAPAIASVTRGDTIYYPISEPQGTKVYNELNIDAIGYSIQKLLGTTDKFRLKEMDSAIYSAIPERTKSGAVVSISDGAIDTPISGGKVYVSPVQSGTGTPAPDNVRPISGFTGSTLKQVGKNLLKDKKYQATTNFVYLGVDDNSTYMLKAGTYTISALTTKWVSFSYAVGGSYTGITTTSFTGGYKGTFTLAQDTELVLSAYNSDGLLPTDISDVMLEVGSSNSDYVEYIEHEIAPISWEAEAGTIYAGYKDLKTGKVFATSIINTFTKDSSITEGTRSVRNAYWFTLSARQVARSSSILNMYCDRLPLKNTSESTSGDNDIITCRGTSYASTNFYIFTPPSQINSVQELRTWLESNPVSIVFPLETPIEYEGDPVSGIYTMLGDNTFFNNTGDTEITYRADIKKLVESLD